MNGRGIWTSLGLVLAVTFLMACTTTTTPTPKPTPTTTSASPAATSKATTVAPTTKPASSPSSAAVTFAGKTVTIVITTGPGGGADIVARIYSRYLSQFLPGKPNMIVRSMPGGQNTIGANYAYSAKPDGLTALLGVGGILLNQLVGFGTARYDLLKMPATVGSTTGPGLMFARKGVFDKPEDINKAKGLVFGFGPGTEGWLFVCAKELLSIPTEKVVLGYAGGADARRALLAGEINMTYTAYQTYADVIEPLIAKGEVMLAFQEGTLDEKGNLVRHQAFPATPTLGDIYEAIHGKSPSGMAWEAYKALVAANIVYDKILFLPPETPDDIVRAYWAAAQAMLKDPGFSQDMGRAVGEVAKWRSGEAYQQEFRQNFGMKPEVVNWLKDTLKKYGVAI